MLAKEITYVNFNNEEKTRTYYFHMTQTEVTELQLKYNNELMEKMNELVKAKEVEPLYYFFKDFVLNAFGMKSDDGDEFLKSAEIKTRFEHSAAFDALMIELLSSDETALSNFMSAIMPKINDQKILPGPGAAPIDGVVTPIV